jgi:N4-gp56 family major capsid protein
MGFFDEYTQDSMDFDTDADLMMHINREMVNGAVEITEDMLQIDLLNSAGVLKFAGAATQDSEVDDTCNATYGDLMRLSIDLDNTRTPKHTNVITGTRMTDTKTINAARVMFIGSELLPLCKGMKDLHNNPAFVSVEKYAAAGTTMNGEVGSIDQFRIVVVPEMLKWEGKGADASATTTHYETGDNYDVFPMLVIGDGSFTTIGFQTDGKTTKFKIINKPPGEATADRVDPYGETGFMAIKWWYGFLLERAERIGLIKTAGNL